MILSSLDLQVLLSALRYSAHALSMEAVQWNNKGEKRAAEACTRYVAHCVDLARRYEQANPNAAKRSEALILPPSLKPQ